MAASTAPMASIGPFKINPTVLSSGTTFRASSTQLAEIRPAVHSLHRCGVVSTRASLSEEHSVTRRAVLANLLGAGAALGISGQALAANPGSLARQKKGERPQSKAKEKPEEVKRSAIESATPTPSPPPEVLSPPVETNLLEISSLPDNAVTALDEPSNTELSSTPEPASISEVPSSPEAPAPEVEAPKYDDFNLGDYFKDLF